MHVQCFSFRLLLMCTSVRWPLSDAPITLLTLKTFGMWWLMTYFNIGNTSVFHVDCCDRGFALLWQRCIYSFCACAWSETAYKQYQMWFYVSKVYCFVFSSIKNSWNGIARKHCCYTKWNHRLRNIWHFLFHWHLSIAWSLKLLQTLFNLQLC